MLIGLKAQHILSMNFLASCQFQLEMNCNGIGGCVDCAKIEEKTGVNEAKEKLARMTPPRHAGQGELNELKKSCDAPPFLSEIQIFIKCTVESVRKTFIYLRP
jgi:hypothetical protein